MSTVQLISGDTVELLDVHRVMTGLSYLRKDEKAWKQLIKIANDPTYVPDVDPFRPLLRFNSIMEGKFGIQEVARKIILAVASDSSGRELIWPVDRSLLQRRVVAEHTGFSSSHLHALACEAMNVIRSYNHRPSTRPGRLGPSMDISDDSPHPSDPTANGLFLFVSTVDIYPIFLGTPWGLWSVGYHFSGCWEEVIPEMLRRLGAKAYLDDFKIPMPGYTLSCMVYALHQVDGEELPEPSELDRAPGVGADYFLLQRWWDTLSDAKE